MDFEYFSRGRSTLLRLPEVADLNRAEHRLNQNFTRILHKFFHLQSHRFIGGRVVKLTVAVAVSTIVRTVIAIIRIVLINVFVFINHPCIKIHICYGSVFRFFFSFNVFPSIAIFFLGKQVESRHINRNQFHSCNRDSPKVPVICGCSEVD